MHKTRSGKGGKDGAAAAAAKKLPGGDVINVFTVASGHMYERLQKIMVLSVVRHTKSRWGVWVLVWQGGGQKGLEGGWGGFGGGGLGDRGHEAVLLLRCAQCRDARDSPRTQR